MESHQLKWLLKKAQSSLERLDLQDASVDVYLDLLGLRSESTMHSISRLLTSSDAMRRARAMLVFALALQLETSSALEPDDPLHKQMALQVDAAHLKLVACSRELLLSVERTTGELHALWFNEAAQGADRLELAKIAQRVHDHDPSE